MKDNTIEKYILDPSPLTELTAALDNINGWDTRDVKLGLYMRNIFNAKNELEKKAAISDFGTYVWGVLYTRVQSELETDNCDEDISLCQAMGER